MSATLSLPLTSLDESFLNLSERALMSVQFEVRVSGRLDGERTAAALREAVRKHPLARARLASATATATRQRWEIAEDADHLALEITDDPADVVRARLQSLLPDLSHSPAFTAALVRDDAGGDLLMLNLHHAAFDGMSAVRLMRSVARAYAGEDDDTGGPDSIEQARDLGTIAGSRSITDLLPRVGKLATDVIDRRAPLVRVAGDGGETGAREYAFATLRLTADEVAAALASKPAGTTVNDLVMAAHTLAIRRWNAAHDAPAGGRVSIMMPVNLRPAEWSTEVLSNYASYLAIMVPERAGESLADATARVGAITRPLKENGAAGWMVDLLDRGNALPLLLKKNLQSLLPLVQDRFVESTVLSNVGRVELPDFGDAGAVREVWFSPPCMGGPVMPLGLGVAGVGRELQIVVRTKAEVISAAGAARYAELLRDTLLSPADS